MHYCKYCGTELGDPEDDLHDPDNLMGIVEGGASNPNTAHLKVSEGAKGPRLYCRPSGKLTSIVEDPPEGEGQGGGSKPEGTQPTKTEEVYEIQEEKSQITLLGEVVSNPTYGLNEGQIDEIKEWAEIYDGRLPPDILQKVVANFNGVSKQTAALMREKYDAKLNKWIREQSQDEGGPPIGVMSSPPMVGRQGQGRRRAPPEPTPERGGEKSINEVRRERREERRRRGLERRQDALDRATEEAVKEGVQEIAHLSRDMRKLVTTLFQSKAEKDPEWFFENFDLLQSLGEPSEARKRELEAMEEGRTGVEAEVDRALESIEERQEEEPERQMESERETVRQPEENEFDRIFGDLAEEEEVRT